LDRAAGCAASAEWSRGLMLGLASASFTFASTSTTAFAMAAQLYLVGRDLPILEMDAD
jgi:hypothetical protein